MWLTNVTWLSQLLGNKFGVEATCLRAGLFWTGSPPRLLSWSIRAGQWTQHQRAWVPSVMPHCHDAITLASTWTFLSISSSVFWFFFFFFLICGVMIRLSDFYTSPGREEKRQMLTHADKRDSVPGAVVLPSSRLLCLKLISRWSFSPRVKTTALWGQGLTCQWPQRAIASSEMCLDVYPSCWPQITDHWHEKQRPNQWFKARNTSHSTDMQCTLYVF